MTEETGTDQKQDVSTDHLDDIDDGCGCAEVWEYMSEKRDSDDESPETHTDD